MSQYQPVEAFQRQASTRPDGPDVHALDHENAENPLDRFKRECGIGSDNALAHALCVHRHTVANMRGRYLTKLERLALAAVKAKLAPWQ